MDWFRHYHGLCTDPKLHKIARKAKVSRGLVIAAWCAILETASQAEPRGWCEDIDENSLAFMIDVKPGHAKRILDHLKLAGMIDEENYVSAWGKRQKESDDVSKRVLRHRERKRKSLKNNETNGSGNVTVTPLDKNRTDIDSVSLRSTGTDAPSEPQPEPGLRKQIWDHGLAFLATGGGNERTHRSHIGKLVRDHGEPAVFAAIAELERRGTSIDPRAALAEAAKRHASDRHKPPEPTSILASHDRVLAKLQEYDDEFHDFDQRALLSPVGHA